MTPISRRLLPTTLAITMILPVSPLVAGSATGSDAANVTIYRDDWGTPHIYAAREADGFYGVGYAMAEDRLAQILFYYLVVSGRLSERFGDVPLDPGKFHPALAGIGTADLPENTVISDAMFLQSRLLDDARSNLARLSPEVRADLDAFVAGIARYMADHPDKVPDWAPERIEPAHVMASDMRFYLPFAAQNGQRNCAAPRRVTSARAESTPAEDSRGSNAWAIGRARSKNGSVFHLADSHGGFGFAGTLFYNWRIKAGDFDYLAFGPAGSPFALFGHSQNFAWGWTDYANRVSDCYAVKTESGAPQTYLYDGKPRTMRTIAYAIKVKGKPDVAGTFDYTDHNGVLSPVVRRDGDVAYVVSSPYAQRAGLSMEQFRDMVLAKDLPRFKQALRRMEVYPNNLVIGGRGDTLLYVKTGREPVRPQGIDGKSVLDGNSAATAWKGLYGFNDLMRIENPATGYVANTNVSPDRMMAASPVRRDRYPASFVIDGRINSRQRRILQLLDASHDLTTESALAIATDNRLFGADRWGPALTHAIAARDGAECRPGFDAFARELATFDGRFSATSRNALRHAEWRYTLFSHYPDAVSDISERVDFGAPLDPAQSRVILAAACQAFESLGARASGLTQTFGDAFKVGRGGVLAPANAITMPVGYNRTWGPPEGAYTPPTGKGLSNAATLNMLTFDPAVTTKDGALLATGGHRAPFLTEFGQRRTRSFSALAFGVSDDPTSANYANQTSLWGRNTLRPTYFNRDDLEAHIRSRLTLTIGR